MRIFQSGMIFNSSTNASPSKRSEHARGADMLKHIATTGAHFTGAVNSPVVPGVSVRTTMHTDYHRSRKRSQLANAALAALCVAVSSVMVTGEVDRTELFEMYDYRLWSYEDRLTLFIIATIPSVTALAAICITHRGIRGLRSAFFSKVDLKFQAN